MGEGTNEVVERGVIRTHARLIDQLYQRLSVRNMSKQQLAESIGASAGQAVRVFSPRENLTLRTIVKNAEALDCDVDIILTPRD